MEIYLKQKNQVLGCILGGALGDAWGRPCEGSPSHVAFEVPSRSSVSDDTQLTLATCESIIENRGVYAERVASCFAAWFTAGRINGMGASTLKALRDLAAGVHWALAGSRGEYSAGNGAAMRIAPLAFFLDPANPADRTVIRDVCRITHHNDEAYIGALAVVVAIRAGCVGTWSREKNFLAVVAESLPDSAVRDRIKDLLPLKGHPSELASKFGSSGWVVDTVPLALYCAQFIAERSISTVIAQAIETGGDTDTIASITGQIAGTVAGVPSDYAEHFSRITGGDEIIQVAERFADFLRYA
ncbi:MAG TPA: ADP-ribosylglycohydrolase family protein [Candidatus Dormibacteraeota bacterium]|jgi:ADP-ribosyl-[dinitrogen reductase] hydrolase|nr:ADP-ribosylglycohydrolase family protein [Candidatus Dormibacteraeota bacterium]